jgi:pyruvate,orthophosphate dikinase
MTKWVYSFGNGKAEGQSDMKNLLGGKGANLAEMCTLGLPVPPGFTINTEICSYYYSNNKQIPAELKTQVSNALKNIEQTLNLEFGNPNNPLLVSVRSGARSSMPGMMDTVLNLGLNDETVEGLAKKTNNPRFAYDSYRRFIQMYSDVVLGIEHSNFEELLERRKETSGVILDTELSSEDLRKLVKEYKEIVQQETKKLFPQNVEEQLWGAIEAVLKSWMNHRAITYRRLNDIPEAWGTAVNIQAMVFGNMGDTSATGVAFTRNPSTGENAFYGEFLINAQGEDVVAGIRTPQAITLSAKKTSRSKHPCMEEAMPEAYNELVKIYKKLEMHYKDMQDIEFTVQDGKLWILQTRSGKRTAAAAMKIAVDMVEEGIISKDEGLLRINPASLDQLLHPTLNPNAKYQVIAKGLPASPGAASGIVVFSAEDAEEKTATMHKVILVRTETSPEDIHGMHVAEGILTSRGGMTSHAAVVARGMGKPCVSGAGSVVIDYAKKVFTANGVTVREGDNITINGATGEVILGSVEMIQPNLSEDFAKIMEWADDVRILKVRANAETPLDAKTARKFGAEGIGLCRTEHMFFDDARINSMREMIISSSVEGRKTALEKLLPMQRDDFIELFNIMDSLPVNIRLLDPPLHEFLPHSEEDIKAVAKAAGVTDQAIRSRALQLKEHNPMLGHRGCRLGITYPEIYEMQARAIFEAMAEVNKNTKMPVQAEIMIPLVFSGKELAILKELIENVAKDIIAKTGAKLNYQIGTMIELPRAALKAGEIAEHAEFFSFGTNDLTQTTFGISRDDASSFLQSYKDQGIVDYDPFAKLDEDGVGELIMIAAERSKKVKKNIKLGICGEHGGHPASIQFCHKIGLDYVSCSPYRVPIARLAAAQAAIMFKQEKQKAA